MSNDPNGSGGTNSQAGGDADNQNPAANSNPEANKNKVDYDSYKKLMDEKKKADRKLEEFQAKEKERQESELRAKENYKALLEQRDKELAEKDTKLKSVLSNLEMAAKITAIVDNIPGVVPAQYYGLFDLSKVATNPETGEPDPMSAQKYAQDFMAEFPEIVKKPNQANIPNNAAKGNGAVMSPEEWAKLPTKKERDAHYKEVFEAFTKKQLNGG